jgi:hypothetical protein
MNKGNEEQQTGLEELAREAQRIQDTAETVVGIEHICTVVGSIFETNVPDPEGKSIHLKGSYTTDIEGNGPTPCTYPLNVYIEKTGPDTYRTDLSLDLTDSKGKVLYKNLFNMTLRTSRSSVSPSTAINMVQMTLPENESPIEYSSTDMHGYSFGFWVEENVRPEEYYRTEPLERLLSYFYGPGIFEERDPDANPEEEYPGRNTLTLTDGHIGEHHYRASKIVSIVEDMLHQANESQDSSRYNNLFEKRT